VNLPQELGRRPVQSPRTWPGSSRPARFALPGATVLTGAVVLATLVTSCGRGAPSAERGFVAELRGLGVPRVGPPLLSVTTSYRACRTVRPAEPDPMPAAGCPMSAPAADGSRAADELSARTNAAAANAPTADALHAAGLLDVLGADGDVRAVTRGIGSLQSAVRLDPAAAGYADLAGAFLIRADAGSDRRDLFAALEYADRAAAMDPRSREAQFNLAVALDRLALNGEAEAEWRRFPQLSDTDAWAEEAGARIHALRADTLPAPPGDRAPDGVLSAYAAARPQEARELAMDSLLAGWGRAVLGGERMRADTLLHRAAVLGSALVARGGDHTVAEEVRAIRTATSPTARRTLARAHVELGEGLDAMYGQARYPEAITHFRTAGRLAGTSPYLHRWARYLLGVGRWFNGDLRQAGALFRQTAAEADTVRLPALFGRAQWSLGLIALRDRRYRTADGYLARAEAAFARIGEAENLAAMRTMRADGFCGLGQQERCYAYEYTGLQGLRRYRTSMRLHNQLYAAAQQASADGFTRAAVRLESEDLRVAAFLRPDVLVEALLANARALIAADRPALARTSVRRARAIADTLHESTARRWDEADFELLRITLGDEPDTVRALASLATLVQRFERVRAGSRALPALVLGADVRIRAGNAAGAARDLERATRYLRNRSVDVVDPRVRGSMLEVTHGVFDRLVMLYANTNRPRDALEALERGRASLGPIPGPVAVHAGPVAAPAGEMALDYALIGDTVLLWVVAETGVRMARRTVHRETFLQTVERVRLDLETGRVADAASRPALAELFRILVQPVAQWTPPGTRLVVVSDGELGAIPFTALWDSGRRRYLLEDHPLRFAATLAEAWQPAQRSGDGRGHPVFVADPALDASDAATLQPLPQTRAAVAAIAATYADAVVLTDKRADAASLAAALRHASLFHFSGHAVFDDEHPEQSYLVLAPSQPGTPGRLRATDLQDMDLRTVRLVVLSACETQRSRSGRSGGFAGLSGAMLAAGAQGVVGSLWSVDDGLTRELMGRFHRAYRASGNAADALRQAQLQMMHDRDPALRSPAAWAGFRYAGR
jgi:CHAT domain-containing protein